LDYFLEQYLRSPAGLSCRPPIPKKAKVIAQVLHHNLSIKSDAPGLVKSKIEKKFEV
jgi:hypothetical protein